MNIAHFEEHSHIYGPGIRFTIWMQGCSIRCPGCWNNDMWDFCTGQEYSVEMLLQKICEHKEEIEGVTFLGGEPLDQYTELLWLVKQLQKQNLSVMLFTGYEMEELRQQCKTELFMYTDIMITGRYIASQRNTELQWRGSANQEVHFLTDKYNKKIIQEGNYAEVVLREDGSITILGFPEKELHL